ncbi:bifunctional riboflavin kinase/FAD synthetase [Fulvivirgaceae bacterium BMA12]|uniref:Riboflavin biosynthesis protein n=1 Tax=Agaribacillus aureus TaxID=3051825 RepID=A0ABT8L8Z8_9BACT|nr:bifunctional riboflavin kinase/FAD synthetase [Fulvivirgaceae bacterium BMA12]
MNIYSGVDDFPDLKYPVVTSGTFDGVHIGHQKILSRIKEIAGNANGETVLITFWPHPRIVLSSGKNHQIKLLSSFDEKAALLERFGIDHLVKIPFTPEFSELSSAEFVEKYLVKRIKTKKLVIGYNHRFGKNREGSFDYLAKNAKFYGFEVEEISKQDLDHVAISSTTIRNALAQGDISHANLYLGRPYDLTGQVIKGNQLGREIGFPTANLQIHDPLKLIPADGAYAVYVEHQGIKNQGMMNIGFRPTVDGKKRAIEVHIFNFDQEIYQQTLKIQLIAQLREEKKFNNMEELQIQLSKDKDKALQILST